MRRLVEWKAARIAAQELANRIQVPVAIRRTCEFGKDGYSVTLVCVMDARAEIVYPDVP